VGKLSELYKEGTEHLQRQEWQEAIEKFMELIHLDIDYRDAVDKLEEARKQQNLEILYAQGIGYFDKQRWSSAAAKFKEVLDLEQGYRDAAAKLEEAERQQKLETLYEQALKQLEQEDWAAAIKTLTRIVKLQPDYQDAQFRLEEAKKRQQLEDLYRQGLEHFGKEEWAKAVHAFQRALELDKNFQKAAVKLKQAEEQRGLSDLYNRGLGLEGRGEWEEAYQLFHQILTTVSEYKDVADRLARTGRLRTLARLRSEADELWAAGRWQEAVGKLSEACELERRCGELDAQTRRELNSRLTAAKKDLKRQEAAYKRGMESVKTGDWPRAVAALRQVLDLNPNHEDAAARLREMEEKSMEPEMEEEVMKLVGVRNAPSRHQPAEGLFDWKKIAQVILIDSIIATILVKLIEDFILNLNPVRLVLVALGVVMIVVAASMIYDVFARQRS
jgi:tetratricopeptide (TPR) repeat protein